MVSRRKDKREPDPISADSAKRHEREIEMARDYAANVVETIQQPLAILDEELRVRTANRAFYQTFELSPEETEGQLIHTLGGGRLNIPGLRTVLADVLPKSMQLENYEIANEFQDREARTLLIHARQLHHQYGESSPLILLAIEDITQRKRDEAVLYSSRMRIQAIVDTATDGIITIDHDGLVDSFNPAAETLFGYTAREVIGRNVSMLMPQPYSTEHDGYIARYLETGQARIVGIGREVVGRRKDGSVFPMELAVTEIDHLRQFTGFIKDVSHRKELERQVLEIAATEQRRIGQELHDGIGQELTGLRFLTNALEDMLPSNDSPEAQLVAKISNVTKSTLEHVREMSRGLIPFSVNAEGLAVAFENLASRSSQLFGIECALDCKTPVLVPSDLIASQFYRIVQEAIVNAVKHGQATKVTIGLHEAAGTIKLQIVDNGKGIDNPNYQDAGVGIRIMQYRAGVVGAMLRITPAKPHGTQVLCTLDKIAIRGQRPH